MIQDNERSKASGAHGSLVSRCGTHRGRLGRSQDQASGLAVVVLTVITLLFLTGLFEDLPEATLAAVVIAALIELVDYKLLLI